MIGLGAPDVKGAWEGLNQAMFTRADSTEHQFIWNGFRKITTEVLLRINKWGQPNLKLSDIGFAPAKWTQLYNIYYPADEIVSYKSHLDKNRGKTFSLSVTCSGRVKKEAVLHTTKGPCLKAITVCFIRGVPKKIHVFYRVTEVTKKFYADLVFLNELFKDLVGREMAFCEVWFHLPMAYCHVRQFPVVDVLIPGWAGRIPGSEGNWKWEDERMGEQVVNYLDWIKQGNLPKYGMVKRTATWWMELNRVKPREEDHK